MDFFEQLIQQLINGISLGSIYALIALGYTMVYGIIKLINFAHGDIYMVGAYVGFYAVTMTKMSIIPALIISMVVTGLLGILVEKIAYKPLRKAPRISLLITAIGVSFFLEYTSMYFVSPTPRTFPNVIDSLSLNIGSFVINGQQLLIFIITVILMVLLTYIVQKTKMGKAMRAVSVDSDAAELMGISVNNTISFTFALGSSLAGAAGVLIGLYYNSIEPLMGMTPGIKAFVAAVLGGIGIIPGAALGGFVIGILETLSTAIGLSSYRDAIVYGVLIVILLLRPAGILGKNVKEKV